VALLAAVYAHPFLALWINPAMAQNAPLMQLFLVAVIPQVIAVHVQMSIGMNRIKVIALAALAGALVNLPLSYVLTQRFGVSGVIWGTVLTTLISNLAVPGVYVFRVLKVQPRLFVLHTLGAPLCGALALLIAAWGINQVGSAEPVGTTIARRSLPLLIHLVLASLAYLVGYLAVPFGRADFTALLQRILKRSPST
jgi:O-antigen/teichoic acid export membrane protein